MREIRNEITNNVRQEMKSELELYKAKLKKLENSSGGIIIKGVFDNYLIN